MSTSRRTVSAVTVLTVSLAPSSAAPAGGPIVPKFECMEMGCPANVQCSEGVCVLTDCGQGSCGFCPEDYQNLVIKGWCRYGCMKGTVRTGDAVLLLTKPFDVKLGPICL